MKLINNITVVDAEIEELDGELYVASIETDEELEIRLSRSADAYEDCGKKVGMTTHEMLSNAIWSAENWENDRSCWDEDCDFPTSNRWFPVEFYAERGYER